MRQFIKVTLLAVFLLTGASTFAQTFKFGHIDSNKLFQIMPERETAEKQIRAAAEEFDTQIKTMQEELQTLYAAYVNESTTMAEALRADKEKEMQNLQNRIKTFDGYAQQELQKKQSELLQPIIEKARQAIKDIGAENGFTYVFDVSTGVILYNSNNSVDVMPLVKTKLGIQ